MTGFEHWDWKRPLCQVSHNHCPYILYPCAWMSFSQVARNVVSLFVFISEAFWHKSSERKDDMNTFK